MRRCAQVLPIPEHDQPVGLYAGLDQLAEAGDAESRREVVVADAAPQRRGDADDEVDAVFLGELGPAHDDVAVVLRRLGQPRRVVDAVVVEKDAMDLVPLGEGGLAEQVSGVAGLVLVGPFVDEDSELHVRPASLSSA